MPLARLCALALVVLSLPAFAVDPQVTVIKAGVLIDGMGGTPLRNAVIVVEGERITAAGAGIAVPASARMLDFSDSTVLPGFIDAHTHISAPLVSTPGWEEARARESAVDAVLRGAFHARQTLEAGYTSIREVGARDFTDVSLRNAIRRGWIVGPRMQVAAHAIGITGGHCDESGWVPNLLGHEPGIAEGIANGPTEIRSAIRYQVKYGADLIKICATGGVVSVGDTAGAQQYDAEELRTAVETAHMLERKVAAHAHGTEGIKAAVRAGVDSIEHGSLLDDEGARLMAEKGTFLVSTLMAGDAVVRMARDGRLTGAYAAKAMAIGPSMPRALARAAAAGVKIVLGTDNIFDPHTTDTREFGLLVAAGLTPMQAIVAGTGTAARLLGWEKDVGSIAPGRYADIVAVKGDPLRDIHVLEHVHFVMKGGFVVKESPDPRAAPVTEAAAGGSGSILYVDNSEGNTLTLVDTASLETIGEIAVGEKPHGLAASPDGRRVYASIESTNELLAIDAESQRIVATVALGERPNQISVSADGRYVYVPLRGEAGLQIVDTSAMQVVKRLDVPSEPHNSYAPRAGRRVYLGCMTGKSIIVVDGRTHVVERRIPMPAPVRPIAIKGDESVAYVALSELHGFGVLDLKTDKIVQRVELPKLPSDTPRPYLDTYTHGLALTPDEKELWVTSVPGARLYAFSVPALERTGEVAVGRFPNWLAFTPDGKTLFVSNTESNTVTAIDVRTRSVRATIAVGRAPKRLIVVPRTHALPATD